MSDKTQPQRLLEEVIGVPEYDDIVETLHDDIAEYAAINHLGGFQNHAMQKARDALALVREGNGLPPP